ncbi:hypothetical protein STEG23_004151, partial [Scotinomys teguina]
LLSHKDDKPVSLFLMVPPAAVTTESVDQECCGDSDFCARLKDIRKLRLFGGRSGPQVEKSVRFLPEVSMHEEHAAILKPGQL